MLRIRVYQDLKYDGVCTQASALLGLVELLVATPETDTVPKLEPKIDETLPLVNTEARELCAAAAAVLSEPVKAYKLVTLTEDATTDVMDTLQTAFRALRMFVSRVLTYCSRNRQHQPDTVCSRSLEQMQHSMSCGIPVSSRCC